MTARFSRKSARNARSAKRKRDSARLQEIDRAYRNPLVSRHTNLLTFFEEPNRQRRNRRAILPSWRLGQNLLEVSIPRLSKGCCRTFSVSDPLPPSAALPLCEGESNVCKFSEQLSPLKRGRAAEGGRGSLTRTFCAKSHA
jgi:hypothetical protein